jgi:hypothetical protein
MSSVSGIKAISAWFKLGYTSANAAIIGGLGYGTSKEYGTLGCASSGRLKWSDGTAKILTDNDVFSANTWHHILLNFVSSGHSDTDGNTTGNGQGWQLYLDGTREDVMHSSAIGSSTHGTQPLECTSDFRIGAELRQNIANFSGLYDEVALWNASLSSSEISSITSAPVDLTTVASSNLVAYYRGGDADTSPSDGGSIATTNDSSGNGYHLSQSTASYQPTYKDLSGEGSPPYVA